MRSDSKPRPSTLKARRFALYPEEQRWWTFEDYQTVLDVMRRIRPEKILEFGPGSSTLALIEGGAASIDTCEDDSDWAQVYRERLVERFPGIVRLHSYEWSECFTIPALDGERFDLTLIDGPRGTPRRPAVLSYALLVSRWVLMPTEEYQTRAWLRPIIVELAGARPVEFIESGRGSGAFALVGPKP